MGGIYGVATQSGTKRGFRPKGGSRVRKNLIDTRQITSQVVAHFRNCSRRSARNYIDAGAPLVPYKSVVILPLVRGNQPKSEQMTVTAAEAAHGRCDSGGSIQEVVWQHHTFPSPGVENGRHSSAERHIVSPELHFQASSSAIEKDRTL